MQCISAPTYYSNFKCIGSQCEDTCCSGWTVNIDAHTFNKYQQCKHEVLAPLFRLALSQSPAVSTDSVGHSGVLKMKPDRSCHFLQQDKLCAIQSNLGAEALSTTCKIYPRYLNQFGSMRETALGISCPEAARLVLLAEEPIQLQLIALDPGVDDQTFTAYRFPKQGEGDPDQIEILNDFRALIIAVLQCREMSIGARMMMLGFLLEDANSIVTAETFAHASELSPTLTTYARMLSKPETLEAQFDQIQPNVSRKLQIMTQLISSSLTVGASVRFSECLLAAADGLDVDPGGDLLANYAQSHAGFYSDFFKERQHIFENYLVNQVISRLFPFTRGSYLDVYRELVFNLAITQVLLVGMAAKSQGLEEALVIQFFQSFARKSDHNRSHLDNLISVLEAGEQDSFLDVMWLLKDV
jgi:lysine-N-methylase